MIIQKTKTILLFKLKKLNKNPIKNKNSNENDALSYSNKTYENKLWLWESCWGRALTIHSTACNWTLPQGAQKRSYVFVMQIIEYKLVLDVLSSPMMVKHNIFNTQIIEGNFKIWIKYHGSNSKPWHLK